jgi:radical SAM protein with 4Fe4S-binding SPASM domain
MMTSNGGGLLKAPGAAANIQALFDAGLNVLALDDYEVVKIVPKIIDNLYDNEEVFNYLAGELNLQVYDYPTEPQGNPHTRRKPHERVLSVIQDISKAGTGTHSLLNNHAGAGAPLNNSQAGKRCAKPFREMSIRWDGNVAVCCNDWRGVYKCGNVVTDGLDKVWNGPAMQAARRKLYHGMRDFGPCKGCDARSYRPGLLPDKLGKYELDLPTKRDLVTIEAACAGESYTAPVLRPWEK